jgi:hypothetical protein
LLPLAVDPVVLAAVPTWVWATLVMIGFVALTALTMWLARYPVMRKPPPVLPPDRSNETGDTS